VLINARESDGERIKTSFRQTDGHTDRPPERIVYFTLGFDLLYIYIILVCFLLKTSEEEGGFLLIRDKGELAKVIVEVQQKEGSKRGRGKRKTDRFSGGIFSRISRCVTGRTVLHSVVTVCLSVCPSRCQSF